jgi:hypothetical protein
VTVWQQFQALEASEVQQPNALTGLELVSGGAHFVFKDSFGRPCALFGVTAPSDATERVLAIELQHVRVEPQLRCRIRLGARDIEGEYGLLRCLSSDVDLQEYLVMVLEKVVEGRSGPMTPSALNALILRLVELFALADATPRGTVVGLWAELFVALRSQPPLVALEAWHTAPEDRYDFAAGVERVEVKCSTQRRREHHFSFEQSYPPYGQSVIVASVFAEATAAGASLGELWDRAREVARGTPDLVLVVEKVCMQVLGRGWESARKARFDLQLAESSLAFYAIESIPRLIAPLPTGVLRAEFVADLGGCPRLARSVDDRQEKLFAAVLNWE